MVLKDKAGYAGFPLGVVEDGPDTFVVVRWFERPNEGGSCDIVTVDRIEDLEVVIQGAEKGALIREACER